MWSPDSKQITFQHLEFGQVNCPGPVYIMDAGGGNQRVLFKAGPDGPSRVAWKPPVQETKTTITTTTTVKTGAIAPFQAIRLEK
jgi:hypothetical protein